MDMANDGRSDGILPALGGRLTPGTAGQEEAVSEDRVIAQDAHIEADAELNTEPEPKPPQVSLAAVERELARIAEMRRTDARNYWRDEALQQRERDLIGQRLRLQAGKAPATAEAITDEPEESELSGAEQRLAELNDDLADVREKQRTARGAQRDALDTRELELLQEIEETDLGRFLGADVAGDVRRMWGEQGGVLPRLNTFAGFATSLRESLGDEAEAFGSEFDGLPKSVRLAVFDHFSTDDAVGLSRRLDMVEHGLTGADLAAAQGFRAKWAEHLKRGLVR
jgi:hypothetical protein